MICKFSFSPPGPKDVLCFVKKFKKILFIISLYFFLYNFVDLGRTRRKRKKH